MASAPPPELIIAQIAQSFSGTRLDNATRARLAQRKMLPDKQEKVFLEGLKSIFAALEFDQDAQRDASRNIWNSIQAHSNIEQQTWTFGAPPQQVLWEHLVHLYIPFIARTAANWTIDERADYGMPDNRFWFLPEPDLDNPSQFLMPVRQVLDWLFDLLGCTIEEFVEQAEDDDTADPDRLGDDGIKRTLYRWKKGQDLPDRETIARFFHDEPKRCFKGSITLTEEHSPDQEYDQVREFIRSKGLSVEKLYNEVNMSKDNIAEAINGTDYIDVRQLFVDRICRRYAPPTMKLVRQRLLFARAVQDGYRRLHKFLCPGTDLQGTEPDKNRIMELVAIFKNIYNLTIEAYTKHEDGAFQKQDQYFEENLPLVFKMGVCWSIMPSMIADGESNHTRVAERLTRIFAAVDSYGALTAYVPHDPKSGEVICAREIEWLDSWRKEHEDFNWYLRRLDKAQALKDIAQEQRLWFLNCLVSDENVSPYLRHAASDRLSDIAEGTVLDMTTLLRKIENAIPAGDRALVDDLLPIAKKHPSADRERPFVLYLEAKHLINSKSLKKAKQTFSAARKASMQGSFGRLRGEIARDLFALEMCLGKFNSQNHPSLYRDMVAYGMIERLPYQIGIETVTAAKQLAPHMRRWFHENIYKPYAK